jgi:ubiquinone biosynthesis protein
VRGGRAELGGHAGAATGTSGGGPAPRVRSFVGRLARIVVAAAGLTVGVLGLRFGSRSAGAPLPQRLAQTFERLGTTFVKFGQALSLHRDLLPDPYVEALQNLQDRVSPFPGELAIHEVEVGLGRPLAELFAEFEPVPFAAASVAQAHKASLHDGRAVMVKVRRPGIRSQIDQDMRILSAVLRGILVLVPRLRRHQPLRLVEEAWISLHREIDFRQEARSIRRFAQAFRDWPMLYVPGAIDDLYSDGVLVQELSGGRRVDDPSLGEDGPRLAGVFVDAYLYQFFVLGVFHGDPHPGNLFVTDDGRLCFHDFGLVGYLDRSTRRSLALFVQAFAHQDAGWLLDAAIDLGVIGREVDRAAFRRGLEEIMADYAALPLKEWSLAQAFHRVVRLGRGEGVGLPHNLLILMRTMFELESTVRLLDPKFHLLEELLVKGEQTLAAVLRERGARAPLERLKSEAALTAQDLPAVLGALLHRLQEEGEAPQLGLRHHGLDRIERSVHQAGQRIALALVTLGLYIAASLLMQHGVGPRVLSDLPLLALLGYGLALWLTCRVLRTALPSAGR